MLLHSLKTLRFKRLERKIAQLSGSAAFQSDEYYGALCCELAMASIREGNYGIGAVLVDPQGRVQVQGRNQVYYPTFRSDLHAEMVVMNRFESQRKTPANLQNYTLFSSLEPCPMCLSRLLLSGVEKIRYVAKDMGGGMAHALEQFPLIWRVLAKNRTIELANCSPELQNLAHDLFRVNLKELRHKMIDRKDSP